jgi:hypothetical protein
VSVTDFAVLVEVSGRDGERRALAADVGLIERLGSYGVGATGFASVGSRDLLWGGKVRGRRWLDSGRTVDVAAGVSVESSRGEHRVGPVASFDVSLSRLFGATILVVPNPTAVYLGARMGSKPGAVATAIVSGAAALLYAWSRTYENSG